MGRLRFEKDRTAFLASRVLLRSSLASRVGCPPASLVFSTHAHGEKPAVVAPEAARPLHFSLTHTEGLVACVMTHAGDVGIDAEPVGRPARLDLLARRVLSPGEHDAFVALPDTAKPRRFFEYWCVKEACLKAEGTGLRVTPSSVSVRFTPRGVHFDDAARAGRWTVRMLEVRPGYVTAVVLPAGADAAGAPGLAVERFAMPATP